MEEVTLKIPDLGEAASNMVVVRWFVEEGMEVKEDENLIEVETDKATIEIPALRGGYVVKHLVKVGDKVKPGDEYVVMVVR